MRFRRSMWWIAIVVLAPTAGAATELDVLPLGDAGRSLELASLNAGAFYDARQGRELEFDELADELAAARVVLLGEEHTHMEQKLFHGRLLEALVQRGRRLVLGMEFFLREDADALEGWRAGTLTTDELLREVGWYDRGGYRFEYYRPVMEVARQHRIPVVGLNVPREILRAVNRGGLDGLDDEQREEVGEVVTENSAEHRYLIARYFGETVAMLPPGWFDNMYAAQCLWDVVMARSILDNLPPDGTMVVIVGSGHVAYDLGIGRRLHEELAAADEPDIVVASVLPVLAPPPDPGGDPHGHPMGDHHDSAGSGKPARFTRSLGGYVAAFADTGGVEAYPVLGLRLDESDGGTPVVSMTWPDTPAAAAGFEHGDRILDVNGVAPDGLSDLRWRLAGAEWGERVGMLIERDGETMETAVILSPQLRLTEVTDAPGWQLEPVAAVDPLSSAVAVADVEVEPAQTTLLVSSNAVPVRIETWAEDRLDEVHELDNEGRIQRSVYREPRADGAVEVRYRRDDEGAVVEAVRLDRSGLRLE